MKEVVNKLINKNKTISTMESCTGGYLASEITNQENSSKILKFSAVTYSNEYKIKMGVDKKIIDTYTVYSTETARCMALAISNYTNSSYGIGITGKLNKQDNDNPYGDNNTVYIAIYDKENNKYYDLKVITKKQTRKENKTLVINEIINKLHEIL
jgi:nicotinamide-nucleotide amidase